jgi:ABC-type Na+ efflux pump permease subunit
MFMNKTLIVATREYLSAVKSKGFIIGVILMPLLMSAGFIAQKVTSQIADTNTYAVAILDRTEGATVSAALLAANEKRSADGVFEEVKDEQTGEITRRQTKPTFDLQILAPAPRSDPAAVDLQRLELSEQTRSGKLLAFVEIGENVITGGGDLFGAAAGLISNAIPPESPTPSDGSSSLATGSSSQASGSSAPSSGSSTAASGSPRTGPPTSAADAMAALAMLENRPDDQVVRYTTARPTFDEFRRWLQANIAQPIFLQRMMRENISLDTVNKVTQLQVSGIVVNRGLAERASDGAISYDRDRGSQITSILVPLLLLMLMFVVVFTGASPMATNVLEEKQMRIAEVLLGGLTPFQLMLGKLLGGVGVALTLAAIYVGGAVLGAIQFDALQYIKPVVLVGFVLFTILGVFMYGGVFLAAGAAVTNVKEVQAIIGPVMIFIVGPMALFGQILEYPSGGIARALTFFPLTAPMVTVMRSAIPPGLEPWEWLAGGVSSVLGTILIVWAAGRIFRIGLLSNSRPESLKQTLAWVLRG